MSLFNQLLNLNRPKYTCYERSVQFRKNLEHYDLGNTLQIKKMTDEYAYLVKNCSKDFQKAILNDSKSVHDHD